MLESYGVNPRIIGVDPNNQVDVWLQYIYASEPEKVMALLHKNGIEASTPSDAIYGMKYIIQDPDMVEELISFDPMFESSAFVYVKRHMGNGTDKSVAISPNNQDITNLSNTSNINALSNPLRPSCGENDWMCHIKELFTLRITLPQILLAAFIVGLLIYVFREKKSN